MAKRALAEGWPYFVRLNEPSNPEALLPHVREVVRRPTGAALRFVRFVFEVSAILPRTP